MSDILFSFRRCPYAMRARWAIIMTRQSVVLREVLLAKKPKELLEISPKGTVPVLVTNEGEVIERVYKTPNGEIISIFPNLISEIAA